MLDGIMDFLKKFFSEYKASADEATQIKADYDKTHPTDVSDQENLDAHPGFSINIFRHRF
jgi:hypothetical protein